MKKLTNMKATNIKWVASDYDKDFLPKEIDIPKGMTDETEISVYLTECTDYCHKGFDLVEGSVQNPLDAISFEGLNIVNLQLITDDDEDPILGEYIVVNPTFEKLNELDEIIGEFAYNDDEWYDNDDNWKTVSNFIEKNFTVIPIKHKFVIDY